MARSERGDGPVSDEEYEVMRERISHHFDKMRELMEQELEKTD